MHVRSHVRAAARGASVVAAGLMLAGCGHSTAAPAPSSSAPLTTATTPPTTPPTTPDSVPPTTSAVPTTVSSSPTAAAPIAPCTTSQLAFSLGPAATAAGRTSVALTLRNTGAAPCTVHGNPAVDVVDSYGMQAGPAAAALPGDGPNGSPATVTLARGASASANLSYVAAADGGAGCSPDTAATLLVFAPGSTTSAKLPFAVSICTAATDRPGITPVVAAT